MPFNHVDAHNASAASAVKTLPHDWQDKILQSTGSYRQDCSPLESSKYVKQLEEMISLLKCVL